MIWNENLWYEYLESIDSTLLLSILLQLYDMIYFGIMLFFFLLQNWSIQIRGHFSLESWAPLERRSANCRLSTTTRTTGLPTILSVSHHQLQHLFLLTAKNIVELLNYTKYFYVGRNNILVLPKICVLNM